MQTGHSQGQLDALFIISRVSASGYISCHVYPHLAIYFGSTFGRYPTFHTLTSVGRKSSSVCLKNVPAVANPFMKPCGKGLYSYEWSCPSYRLFAVIAYLKLRSVVVVSSLAVQCLGLLHVGSLRNGFL